jgi:acyl-CoA thioesterase FadM
MKWMNNIVPTNGDVGLVVRELSIKYIKPLKLGDEFHVESDMLTLGNASLKCEQRFVKDGVVHAIIKLTAAYIGADLKPRAFSDQIRRAIESI